ncbi:MAG: hypothetical protein R6V53_01440 [Candidatus Woesearchaeota archaeon]
MVLKKEGVDAAERDKRIRSEFQEINREFFDSIKALEQDIQEYPQICFQKFAFEIHRTISSLMKVDEVYTNKELIDFINNLPSYNYNLNKQIKEIENQMLSDKENFFELRKKLGEMDYKKNYFSSIEKNALKKGTLFDISGFLKEIEHLEYSGKQISKEDVRDTFEKGKQYIADLTSTELITTHKSNPIRFVQNIGSSLKGFFKKGQDAQKDEGTQVSKENKGLDRREPLEYIKEPESAEIKNESHNLQDSEYKRNPNERTESPEKNERIPGPEKNKINKEPERRDRPEELGKLKETERRDTVKTPKREVPEKRIEERPDIQRKPHVVSSNPNERKESRTQRLEDIKETRKEESKRAEEKSKRYSEYKPNINEMPDKPERIPEPQRRERSKVPERSETNRRNILEKGKSGNAKPSEGITGRTYARVNNSSQERKDTRAIKTQGPGILPKEDRVEEKRKDAENHKTFDKTDMNKTELLEGKYLQEETQDNRTLHEDTEYITEQEIEEIFSNDPLEKVFKNDFFNMNHFSDNLSEIDKGIDSINTEISGQSIDSKSDSTIKRNNRNDDRK